MKRYEKVASYQFHPRNAIIVRVDGVAFHTFTKGANKPFDGSVSAAMFSATESVASAAQGCVLAYTQSDEATFLLTDLQGPNSQGWFGFKKSKLESVVASMFTYHFNEYLHRWGDTNLLYKPNRSDNEAFFDARSFSVPLEDAPNVFVWRQKDCYRNYIQALAQHEFGHAAIQGKPVKELEVELQYKATAWSQYAYGYTLFNHGSFTGKATYEEFRNLIEKGTL